MELLLQMVQYCPTLFSHLHSMVTICSQFLPDSSPDFNSINDQLIFNSGSVRGDLVCEEVTIIDDSILEDEEKFTVLLDTTDADADVVTITITADVSTVVIREDSNESGFIAEAVAQYIVLHGLQFTCPGLACAHSVDIPLSSNIHYMHMYTLADVGYSSQSVSQSITKTYCACYLIRIGFVCQVICIRYWVLCIRHWIYATT